MALAPLSSMTPDEIREYVEKLEYENQVLRKKTDNSRRLDMRDARRIRDLYSKRNWKQWELAEAFNVNPGTISRIVNNKYYAEEVPA